jgi:hypothetical protein
VPDDGVCVDADRSPHRAKGGHLHEQRGLYDRGVLADVACTQQIAKGRFAEQFPENTVAAVGFGPERRNGLVEQRAHAGPLSALTGQHEGESVRGGGRIASHHGGMLAAIDDRPQGVP